MILPPSDTSLQEAAAEFTGEGLIPDWPPKRSAGAVVPGRQRVALDRDPPEREPALDLGLDRQFLADLGLDLQLALGVAFLLRRPAWGRTGTSGPRL